MGRSRSRGRGRSRSDHDGDRGRSRSRSSSSSSSSEDSEERLEREREREFREQESQEKRAQKKAARKAERERAEAKAQAEREQHAAIERLGRATWRFTAAGDEDDDFFSLELRGKKPESDAFFLAGIVTAPRTLGRRGRRSTSPRVERRSDFQRKLDPGNHSIHRGA